MGLATLIRCIARRDRRRIVIADAIVISPRFVILLQRSEIPLADVSAAE